MSWKFTSINQSKMENKDQMFDAISLWMQSFFDQILGLQEKKLVHESFTENGPLMDCALIYISLQHNFVHHQM
jgi:hypothetical protein